MLNFGVSPPKSALCSRIYCNPAGPQGRFRNALRKTSFIAPSVTLIELSAADETVARLCLTLRLDFVLEVFRPLAAFAFFAIGYPCCGAPCR